MFGKKTGMAMPQMAKKAAPKMAQKAPAQKAPSQFVPKMPIVSSDNLKQAEAAHRAFEASQKARGVKSMPPSMGALGAIKGLGQMASQPRPGGFLSGAAGIPQNQRTQANSMAALGGAGIPQNQRTQANSMAALGGAGTGLLKAFGAKKGGAVPSKMGAVKTSAKRDGVATKGKTKATMVKMAKGGKAR